MSNHRLCIIMLFAAACGRGSVPGLEDSLDDVRILPETPVTDGGSHDRDAGAHEPLDAGLSPNTCAPELAVLTDGLPVPVAAPAELGASFRRADANARRLARAQRGEPVCPDEAWAWVGEASGREVIVVVALTRGARRAALTIPAQGVVRHLELLADQTTAGGWVVAWVTDGQGLFTALLTDSLAPPQPQRLPEAVMPAGDPRPFELTWAWERPWLITHRLTTEHREHLVVASVPLSAGPGIENHVDFGTDLGFGASLASPAAYFDGSSLFVYGGHQVSRFAAPDEPPAVTWQSGAGPWHDTTIVALPPSPQFAGGSVLVGAGERVNSRRIGYQASCFTGACSWWEELPGGAWGGVDLWNHAGVSAAACGRKLAVAFKSFDDIGDCANFGYCQAGDLHVSLLEQGPRPVDINVTPRVPPPDAGAFLGYDDQDVFSPVVFARAELNRPWPVADVGWLQASADGGVELRLARRVADCAP